MRDDGMGERSEGSAGQRLDPSDDDFDLDMRILPSSDPAPPDVTASGTCGGCPKWTEEGSTCKFSCQDSCGGTCTCGCWK